jgi:hypothetical protein
MKKHLIITAICIQMLTIPVFGQGCSDAGFCTIGALKDNGVSSEQSHAASIAIGVGLGMGLEATSSITSYLEYNHAITSQWNLGAKITGGFYDGDLGSNAGPGDFYLSGTYVPKSAENHKFSILVSIKSPLAASDAKDEDEMPLPMEYQSSLGTFDIIAGLSYQYKKKWEFSTGIQLPVSGVNKNEFLRFPSDSIEGDYNSTREFERAGDVLLRAGYLFRFQENRLLVKPNLLAIYHLGKDSYTDVFDQRQNIENSDGLTLNAGIMLTRIFRNNHQLEVIAAAPLVVREERPDGLTRSFVFNIQYQIPLFKSKK